MAIFHQLTRPGRYWTLAKRQSSSGSSKMLGGFDHCTIKPARIDPAFLSISRVVVARRLWIPMLSPPSYCHFPAVTYSEPSLNRSCCSEVLSSRSSSIEFSIPRPEQWLPVPQRSRYCPTRDARGLLGLREQPHRDAAQETATITRKNGAFISRQFRPTTVGVVSIVVNKRLHQLRVLRV